MITDKIEIKDGSTISYRFTGDTSKPVISLLSGSIFNYTQFDPVLFPYIKKFTTNAYSYLQYDYVGIGGSSPLNGDFDFLEITRQHVELLDALGIQSAHHFGYSKGSLISFFTASAHPDRVLTVTGYGNPNLGSPTQDITHKEFRKRVQYLKGISGIWHELVDERNFKIVYDTVLLPTIFANKNENSLSFKEKIINWWIRRSVKPMLVGTLIENIVKLYQYYMKETQPEDKEKYIEAMKGIKTPSLLLHGTLDEIVPHDASKLLSEWIEPSTYLEFPFTHTSPVLNRFQGRKLMKSYADFLKTN
ncbi:MAG: alpha/beta fold hydrolase [Candidatus Kariarchaeaceae archaeon]